MSYDVERVADSCSRLSNWIQADEQAGKITVLTASQLADLQDDISIVIEAINLEPDLKDKRLEYTSDGDIQVYVTWCVKEGIPHLRAITTSEAGAQRYRSKIETDDGYFEVQPFILNHEIARNFIESLLLRSKGK